MEAKYIWLNSLFNKNKSEFSQWPEIQWANIYNARDLLARRDALIEETANSLLFKGTKPYLDHISKGCGICGRGKWSCLFITNKCNAGCFYCPAPQVNDEPPSTQELDFNNPDDYADYVNYFQFEGVSFSGGEPLLFYNRTLDYLKSLRNKSNPDLYIWMYTNGILANKNKLKKFADKNLNEIRFDIGATNFSLDKVKIAKDIIPCLTIEIPCIPEEKDNIISLIPQMIKAGVSNLNLHHLRLTRHNANNLVKRGYTFISAERPLVLESEIAALEIISKVRQLGYNIGINYCSFHFKDRFQKAGFRTIIAQKIFPDSYITENGYIREYDGNSLSYKTIRLLKNNINMPNEATICIEDKTYNYVVVPVLNEPDLSAADKKNINCLLEYEPEMPPDNMLLFKIWQFEYIEKGLIRI